MSMVQGVWMSYINVQVPPTHYTLTHTHSLTHDSHTLTQGGGAGRASRDGRESTKNILENMPELWDEELYKNEYDLSNIMQSLATSNKN